MRRVQAGELAGAAAALLGQRGGEMLIADPMRERARGCRAAFAAAAAALGAAVAEEPLAAAEGGGARARHCHIPSEDIVA